MKKTLKGYVTGLICGVILASASAFAISHTTLNDVAIGGIKIVVDNKEIIPTDARGDRVEPMIYNGTTYLPVRAVAEAFGKEVYWDGPNYTVYLGDMDGELEYPTVELRNMKNIGGGFYESMWLTDNYGNRYRHALYYLGNSGSTEYLLNMKYSRFKGTLYVREGTDSTFDLGYLEIIADGKTIYTSDTLTKTSRPIDIDVDITGCNYLTIRMKGSRDMSCISLGNAGFYQ